MVQSYIETAVQEHKLDPSFCHKVEQWFKPLAEKISTRRKQQKRPLIVGVQGTQGSGKSTLADFLKLILKHEHGLTCIVASIDDFYLTRMERQKIAKSIHPLLITRGVPGTHDIGLATNILDELVHLKAGEATLVPTFNKAIDDRSPIEQWSSVNGPVDVIILEGWCVGLTPQPADCLREPVNVLETDEDPQAIWRTYVNKQLEGEYKTFFEHLDCLAVLNAPSFSCVFEWRLLQEQKLASKLTEDGRLDQSQKLLTGQQVKRFIAHYQRLTEYALVTMPQQADWVMQLDMNHNITSFEERGGA